MHWCLTGIRDTAAFFGALFSLTPEATTLTLAGQAIAPAVRQALAEFLELEMTVVPPGVGWPTDWRYELRYRYSPSLVDCLQDLAQHHSRLELCTDVFVARHSDPLLEWWDAFENDLLVAHEIPELRVRLFCTRIGARMTLGSVRGSDED
jgi:hypothetical protein